MKARWRKRERSPIRLAATRREVWQQFWSLLKNSFAYCGAGDGKLDDRWNQGGQLAQVR